MKIISETSLFVKQVISQQKYDDTLDYRKLNFIIKIDVEDGILLYNYLTLQLILLSQEEYRDFLSENKNEFFVFFVENWFYVPKDFDEIKTYYEIRNFAKMTKYGSNYRQYTIFSTMDCNARCFYCFENGKKREHMASNTAKQVAKFIIDNSINSVNQLRWFGGEPLCNTEAIDIICNDLRERDIPFVSSFVSNGYLFDEETIIKAKNDWNANSIHISLDGTEAIYNRIKNYIYKNDPSPFKTIISNIHNLLKHDLNVIIRMNVSEENATDLEELIEVLSKEFFGETKFSMYLSLLHKSDLSGFSSDDNIGLEMQSKAFVKLINKIFDRGFYKGTIKTDIFANICKADSDSSYVILPNGNFTRCENYTEEDRLGNVFDGEKNTELKNTWKEFAKVKDSCYACPLVPECISLKNCNHGESEECDSAVKSVLLETTILDMKQTYHNFLANSKNQKS